MPRLPPRLNRRFFIHRLLIAASTIGVQSLLILNTQPLRPIPQYDWATLKRGFEFVGFHLAVILALWTVWVGLKAAVLYPIGLRTGYSSSWGALYWVVNGWLVVGVLLMGGMG